MSLRSSRKQDYGSIQDEMGDSSYGHQRGLTRFHYNWISDQATMGHHFMLVFLNLGLLFCRASCLENTTQANGRVEGSTETDLYLNVARWHILLVCILPDKQLQQQVIGMEKNTQMSRRGFCFVPRMSTLGSDHDSRSKSIFLHYSHLPCVNIDS